MKGNLFIGNDVGNHGPSTLFEDAEDFFEELLFERGPDQVEHAIGNDNIHGVRRDEGLFHAEVGSQ
ncbi:MAG: hypothetical protein ACJAVK_002765 [Akkermansiaceae bacterium]|jgi:hypothetical protein